MYQIEEDDVAVEVCTVIINGILERNATVYLQAIGGTGEGMSKLTVMVKLKNLFQTLMIQTMKT